PGGDSAKCIPAAREPLVSDLTSLLRTLRLPASVLAPEHDAWVEKCPRDSGGDRYQVALAVEDFYLGARDISGKFTARPLRIRAALSSLAVTLGNCGTSFLG